MRSRKKVDAVYDDDLLKLLDNLELKEQFLEGSIICAFCGEIIDWENFHSIFPNVDDIQVCCTNPICVNTLIARFS